MPYLKKKRGDFCTVNFHHKLDTLQRMHRDYGNNPNAAYLIGLLAEHAEEEEMTGAFLEWVTRMFKGA